MEYRDDLEVYNNGIYNEASDAAYYRFMVGHTADAWSSSYAELFLERRAEAITLYRKVIRTILAIPGLQQVRKLFLTTRLPVDGTGRCCVV